jgi:uroporphyrinogen-III decarboxylase
MGGTTPDRVPVMCQLSLGHMYKNCDMGPVEFWYTSEGYAEASIQLTDRYGFEGILLAKTGRDPGLKEQVRSVVASDGGHVIEWEDGAKTFVPPDDYPYPVGDTKPSGKPASADELDPASIPVIEHADDLPGYYFDVIDYVLPRRGDTLSIHGEVGTPFANFLRLFDTYENGLMALLDDPDKAVSAMEIIQKRKTAEALAQCSKGIDALKLSSAFSGSGFISRGMYEQFVLPFERAMIAEVHRHYDIPCYIHTCGAIGDRLDLMVRSGTDGIECLDPPPLGDVELEDAVREIGDSVFIKGNLDSVNELVLDPQSIEETVERRLEVGKRCTAGYILSTACSISPKVPPEKIELLAPVAARAGAY